jgi:ribonucleotide reductase beta subunit family protein with ferritin-like domain
MDKKCMESFVGKPERSRPLERYRYKWEDNIRMERRKMFWEGLDRIKLAQDRDQWQAVVNTVMNIRFP